MHEHLNTLIYLSPAFRICPSFLLDTTTKIIVNLKPVMKQGLCAHLCMHYPQISKNSSGTMNLPPNQWDALHSEAELNPRLFVLKRTTAPVILAQKDRRTQFCCFLWRCQIDVKCYRHYLISALQSFQRTNHFIQPSKTGSMSLREHTINSVTK